MSENPFEILGLTPAFHLDAGELQKKLVELASKHHPDRFTDPLDQADAADRLAAVNHAHRLLRDPLSRAGVLLAMLGDAAGRDEKALPPTLLMEMMELREEMEQAIADDDQPTLARLRQWALDQQQSHLDTLGDLLTQALNSPGTSPSKQALLQQAQLELNTLRYIARMLQQMP